MAEKIPITFFAPSKRESIEVIQRQVDHVSRSPQVRTFLNASLNYLLVLNNRRQIVLASDNLLELLPDRTMAQVIGLRPGEALGSIHAFACESGCGTSKYCHQ